MGQSFNAPYEAIGEELLSQLVDTFYERVASHPLLKPIFPSDLTETARKQKQFLTQYLGGPPFILRSTAILCSEQGIFPFQLQTRELMRGSAV